MKMKMLAVIFGLVALSLTSAMGLIAEDTNQRVAVTWFLTCKKEGAPCTVIGHDSKGEIPGSEYTVEGKVCEKYTFCTGFGVPSAPCREGFVCAQKPITIKDILAKVRPAFAQLLESAKTAFQSQEPKELKKGKFVSSTHATT